MVKNQMFPIQCKIEAPYLNHELKTMFIELSFGWKQWSRQHLWCTTCIFQAGASIELSHWSTAGSTGLPIGRREQAICGVDNPHIIQKSLTLAVNGDHRLPHTLDIFDEKQIIPSFMSRVSHKNCHWVAPSDENYWYLCLFIYCMSCIVTVWLHCDWWRLKK